MKKIQINEMRSVLRQYIKEEMDAVAAENDIEDAFQDLESEIDKLDLDAPESEGTGLMIAGVALSLPAIIELIGKFLNLLKRIPGLKKLNGDRLIAIGHKYHHKITGAIAVVLRKAGVKDKDKAMKFANILHHVIVAMLLIAGSVDVAALVSKGAMSAATLKSALNAVKANELRAFLIAMAGKI